MAMVDRECIYNRQCMVENRKFYTFFRAIHKWMVTTNKKKVKGGKRKEKK